MAEITIDSLAKRFGKKQTVPAVDNVSLHVKQGELLVLLGPSGCGKTTTLRCLAGLENPDSGTIRLGDQVVYDRDRHVNVPVHRRDIGFVFQSYALWPHLSAFANIKFPLRSRHVSGAECDTRVRDVAKLLDLDDELLHKRPGQLSGGQQQRVSLARALVAEPAVVLFDEPLSNLDARLREQLRLELRSLHQRVGFTGVYVTHDLAEALVLGDRVAVMSKGRVEQIGDPLRVFESPATSATASLLGFRKVVRCLSRDGVWRSVDGDVIHGALPTTSDGSVELSLYVRPDRVRIRRPDEPQGEGIVISGGSIEQISSVGTHSDVVIALGAGVVRLVQDTEAATRLTQGDAVMIEIPYNEAQLYDADGADHTIRRTDGDRVLAS